MCEAVGVLGDVQAETRWVTAVESSRSGQGELKVWSWPLQMQREARELDEGR